MVRAMRIVGGTLGGRVLSAPAGAATRPTSEKVREAIFAILGDPGAGDHILDLFAGSGGLGLEALSRGAAHATFVDAAKPALAAVRANLATLGLAEGGTVVPGDAIALASRHVPPSPWTLVFIDPPYASALATRAVTALLDPTGRRASPPARRSSSSTIADTHLPTPSDLWYERTSVATATRGCRSTRSFYRMPEPP